ncbi:DinB family protein [Metabacillus iocasae]|uniref:Damage-inducible protein DinB n=1 Tax=Priestia iocasae TaxID=2291674 RepID=A0ABS2QU88_9BACI|nr:DinB family protein [Metabacillus iocasae]MBM7703045.1 putative damage-inducible protein DinB [Metabacillus iocasae]
MLNTLKLLEDASLLMNHFKHVDDDMFFSPIEEDKWSLAGMVEHLRFWDRYLINERIPYFTEGAQLSRSDIDVDGVNQQSETNAQSGISKEELIEQFISTRKQLVQQLETIPLETVFSIEHQTMTVNQFISQLIEHDLHHLQQMVKICIK